MIGEEFGEFSDVGFDEFDKKPSRKVSKGMIKHLYQ